MTINETFTDMEKVFNIAGSLPVVAIFSSGLRLAAAKIQIAASVVIGGFSLLSLVVSHFSKKWEDVFLLAGEHLLHGILNLIRASGELLAGFTVIGSLVFLAYQLLSENRFEPIIKYSKPIPEQQFQPPPIII